MTLKELVAPMSLMVSAALLLAAATGFLIVPADAILPIHWGIDGRPDGFAPRNTALLMPIGIAAVLFGLYAIMARYGARGQVERGRHLLRGLLPALLGVFLVIEIGVVLVGVGAEVDMARMLVLAVAVLLMVMGNLLPKTQPNHFAGIRLPWMMNHALAWQAGHRVAGNASIVAGLLLMLLAIVTGAAPVLFAGMLAALVLPMVAGSAVGWRVSRQA